MPLGLLAGCGNNAASPPASEPPATKADSPEAPPSADPMDEQIAAAKAEGELVVYGSCEEEYGKRPRR